MGGTFDPPHIGHLAIAEQVREKLELAQIWFIPTAGVYYKNSENISSPQDRLAMVELAIAGNPSFLVDSIEIDNGGNSYTFQTMEELNNKYPQNEFVFIVGADSLAYMENWREPERIFKKCTIAAVIRNGFSMDELIEKRDMLIEKFNAKIELVDIPMLDVSSTGIRQRFSSGESIRYLVRDSVLDYIKEHRLY